MNLHEERIQRRMMSYRYHLVSAAQCSFDPEHKKMLQKLFVATHERKWTINGNDGPIIQVELIEGRVSRVNTITKPPEWVGTVVTIGREFFEVIEAIKAHGQPITVVAYD